MKFANAVLKSPLSHIHFQDMFVYSVSEEEFKMDSKEEIEVISQPL